MISSLMDHGARRLIITRLLGFPQDEIIQERWPRLEAMIKYHSANRGVR
jgi:hypothetical protein